MLDVHAPHERVHGFRDFLVHLFTITIGLADRAGPGGVRGVAAPSASGGRGAGEPAQRVS
jgi:hypothetical protein